MNNLGTVNNQGITINQGIMINLGIVIWLISRIRQTGQNDKSIRTNKYQQSGIKRAELSSELQAIITNIL